MSNQLAVIDGDFEEIVPAIVFGLAELIARFLDNLDVRASSKGTYSRQLREFVSWLRKTGREHRLQEMSRVDILAYRDYLANEAGEDGRGLSAYSVGGYLTAVRRLYSWLESEKIYPDITRNIKGPKMPKNRAKDTLNGEQLRACLAAIESSESLSESDRLRNFAIFNLAARTGLRTIEIARATIGNIRRDQGEIMLYVHGKGRDSADEFVLLTPEAYEPIKAYLATRGRLTDEDSLFASSSRKNMGESLSPRSISRIIKNSLKAAGLDDKRLSAHSMRHSAITMAILGGAEPEQVQAMARHASLNTTMSYFNNLNRISHAAERFISF